MNQELSAAMHRTLRTSQHLDATERARRLRKHNEHNNDVACPLDVRLYLEI